MSGADFALQWLDFLGIKVYNKGKRILEYKTSPKYEIKPLDTKIKIGQALADEDQSKFTNLSWKDFDKLGFAIKPETNVHFWRQRQQVAYYIVRKRVNTFGLSYDAFKFSKLVIQHDPIHRRIRLIGINVIADETLAIDSGVGPWVIYDPDAPKAAQKKKYFDRNDIKSLLKGEKIKTNTQEYHQIEEVPLMISDEGYIVCIEHNIRNIPRILVTGQPRKGKSLFCNAASSRMFLKWGYKVGWLFDIQGQFIDISYPQSYAGFIKQLNIIGEEPCPIPALQFYLACKYQNLVKNKDISFILTLDFYEFLNKFHFYSDGVASWKLKSFDKYYSSPKDRFLLKDAETKEELNDIFYERIPEANEKSGGNLRSMIFSWVNTFESIFTESFTSNLYKSDPAATHELTIEYRGGEKITGHPFIMAMEAGLIPVINISYVPTDSVWIRNYLADLMQKILQNQKKLEFENKNRPLVIVVDEMQTIYEERAGKAKDNCSRSFEQIFRQGAFNKQGFVGNTQSLDKLNPEMVKNASLIACVYTQSKKERDTIKSIFNLTSEVTDMLGELKPKQIMLFSNEPFVIYDRWGRRRIEEDRKWYKGEIIPPPNYHKDPASSVFAKKEIKKEGEEIEVEA